MDTETATSILYGDETANHLQSAGTLINDPDFLLELTVDGDVVRETEPFGVHRSVGDTDLDYIVHRLKGVSLSDKISYYKEHEVVVATYGRGDGDEGVEVNEFIATSEGWEPK